MLRAGSKAEPQSQRGEHAAHAVFLAMPLPESISAAAHRLAGRKPDRVKRASVEERAKIAAVT